METEFESKLKTIIPDLNENKKQMLRDLIGPDQQLINFQIKMIDNVLDCIRLTCPSCRYILELLKKFISDEIKTDQAKKEIKYV